MRRYQKQLLLQMLETLSEANGVLSEQLYNKHESAFDLLTQCQEFACHIGETIEQCHKSCGETISLLEEYCETLFQISLLQTGKCCSALVKQLQRLVEQVKRIVCQSSVDRCKIVFMPYQASMWDSMESVWRAVSSDDAFEWQVVPIPYLTKDTVPETMHYEGDKFPPEVNITYWKDLDLQNDHPDVIIYQNPYDDINLVTEVHPDYYVRNLRKCADELIYIPYFVCAGEVTRNLCVLPGVLYADRVIVQSESIKRTYVDELKKFYADNHYFDRFGDPEEKVLAFGSPKFDKLVTEMHKVQNIPEQWERIILDESGARKKIFLYNTSLAGLLRGRENYLDKMEDTFKIFKREQNIVLWWRPHPLTIKTICAMLPQLKVRYAQITAKYQEDGFGIYDDSVELHRALVLADAYYGDGGSLLALFQATGKPAMVQNVEMLSDE